MIEKPRITVVTVVYNGVETLEETILSVIGQTYTDFEYIIIDGGSNDGTLDIIKKYENNISSWISEPDKGIFDAMNKGLQRANGEWLNFMNSGDMFYNSSILRDVFSDNFVEIDMIYGDVCLYDEKDIYFFKCKTNKVKINLNAVCHQSVFIKTKLHPPFSLDLKLSADHEIIYQFVKNKKTKYIDNCISRILIGGVSSDLKATRREKFRITLRYGNSIDVLLGCFFYLHGMLKDFSKRFILKVFPVEVFYMLRHFKNKIEEK